MIEETLEWRHKPTYKLDADGQGDAHFQFAFSAHRAVVDVDTELGLVRVVELATTQEVGKAMNPQALEGQIEGGSAQGLGLALLEEIQVKDGKVMNASFTDYLLPTILDMPPRADGAARARGSGRAVRPQGRRRAAQHLDAAGRRRRAARRHGARPSRASRSGLST